MRKRKEPLLGDSPRGDAGIVYRTLVRIARGIPTAESKAVYEAAVSQPLVSPSVSLATKVREIVKGASDIPEIHRKLHMLFDDPETNEGYTLPRISSVPIIRVKEYSPRAYEHLKGSMLTKNGAFVLVLAKSRSGSWKLII
jgi:hypothetical protein